MPEYVNPHSYAVHLLGPDGKSLKVKPHQRVILSEFFDKYRARGFLRLAQSQQAQAAAPIKVQAKVKVTETARRQTPQSQIQAAAPAQVKPKRADVARARKIAMAAKIGNRKPVPSTHMRPQKQIVGKSLSRDPNELLRYNLDRNNYPVSNGIAVGIMSFNRAGSLRRLVDSIIRNTDLRRTTVFISDDGSTDPATVTYLNELSNNPNFVILRNQERSGIACNSNRLLRCLSRFQYGLLLNDDVEILNHGWEYFYPDVMVKTGMHHFMYRQYGVYGADLGTVVQKNGVSLLRVEDKPHGAILAFDNQFLKTCGYFDESYGLYGMEHVDWSQRVWELGLQDAGFFDVSGSDNYFKLYAEPSAVQERSRLLQEARTKFAHRRPVYVGPSEKSRVPEIAYVVPFRDFERTASIATVMNNLRAQRFPVIHLIMVEQDSQSQIDISQYAPVNHYLVTAPESPLFNKSRAFNVGVAKAPCDMVILHDADMLAQGHYTQAVADILRDYESCHIGSTVLYTTQESMKQINASGIIDAEVKCERVVGYYEGGSLAVTKKGFWKCGGFNEDYWGYGCFLPGNYVLTQAGYKPIETVTASDRLYTHECEFQPIELRSRHYDGTVLDVYVPGRLPIKGVTPNHPFLVQTGPDEFMWRRADTLNNGDVIASTDFLPELVPSYDLSDLANLDLSKNSFDVYAKMDQFCYLLGLYLADGVLQTPDKLRTVCYYLSQSEEFLAKHVERLVQELHPDINVAYHYVKNGCREVRVFNSLLAKTIKAVAGRHQATSKVVSQSFINGLTDRQLSLLLGGGCDGDADHGNGSERRHVYHSSSINLAMAYSGIMRRLGIAHSFGKRSGGSFPGSSDWTFDLCVNREFEHLISTVYTKPSLIGSSSMGRSKFGTVYDIKSRSYSGPVYNFEVADDHSYVVNGLFVHNCEDCDFYARLSGTTKWKEDRMFDFLHLWHSRVSGWHDHHDANKALEASLKRLQIADRVDRQREQLRRIGYSQELAEALK